jgi:transposase
MRDTELYRHLLGVEKPWCVERVELDVKEGRVDVWTEHADGERFACPECDTVLPIYDHAPERSWRHLDSCQFMTYLHARPPRVNCSTHGVRQARLPWAEPRSRFTAMFERLVIDVLREADVLGAARLLRLSWDEAWNVMRRAVRRGLLAKKGRVVARIGIDEKAAAKGHKYVTIVCSLDDGSVEHVADDRTIHSLDDYFASRTPEQLHGIEAVAMDMWDPFIGAVRDHVPNGLDKIVFDPFHIMRNLNKAVDIVRKQEHRALRAVGDETLLGTKYLWLYADENLPARHREHFADLRRADLKTGRAWAIKESFRRLWSYATRTWAERHWRRWYFWATHSRLKPVVDAAYTLQRHIANVMTFFKHRITNALAEGVNSKIQLIKHRARGFRNRDNFKIAIYFHCGNLDLYPATHSDPG